MQVTLVLAMHSFDHVPFPGYLILLEEFNAAENVWTVENARSWIVFCRLQFDDETRLQRVTSLYCESTSVREKIRRSATNSRAFSFKIDVEKGLPVLTAVRSASSHESQSLPS
jgi:hypothetical protein